MSDRTTLQTSPRSSSGAPGKSALARHGPWVALFFVMGCAAGIYLHWPALNNPTIYKSDIRQSPHWAAYHTDTFHPDDLLVRYGAFNESPIQNLIFFVGTLFVDMVVLTKWWAVFSYGLFSALFFLLGRLMLGFRAGLLTGIFFTFFPDQFDYSAGSFSKGWMIPLLLVCVLLIEKRAWRWLLLLMPVAALAYPVTAVLIGITVLTSFVLDLASGGKQWRAGLRWLIMASLVAVTLLSLKYISPDPRIGPMTAGSVLLDMPEMYSGGLAPYLPVASLNDELLSHVENPFIIYAAIIFFLILGPRGIGWRPSWTALFVASVVGYLLADYFFMSFYIPNRYTRYSIVVLLALWHGENWGRVLARISWKPIRYSVCIAMLASAAFFFQDVFRQGKDTTDRTHLAPLNTFLSTLPPQVLIAGHPRYMDDIPVQARRSTLSNYKLAHPWFTEYYGEIRRRTIHTFQALYARQVEKINFLADEYGVTHLVVVKHHYSRSRMRQDLYVEPYNPMIKGLARPNVRYLLAPPPSARVVYQDRLFWVVQLPLPDSPPRRAARE